MRLMIGDNQSLIVSANVYLFLFLGNTEELHQNPKAINLVPVFRTTELFKIAILAN